MNLLSYILCYFMLAYRVKAIILKNPGNLTSLFGRHLEGQQGTQLHLIQYLQLHLVHGLVQIAGKKQFDPFSQCTFSYPNYINSQILPIYV